MDGSAARSPEVPQLQLEGFQGPLDLLLGLARRQQVDLARISISALGDQYVHAVTEAARTDLRQAADWLVMAAWLTWLKSRLLHPADPEETREAQQARRLLTDRLIELERVRSVADWLDGQPQLGWDVFERGFREPQQSVAPAAATFLMLMEVCVGLFRLAAARLEQVYQPRCAVDWTPHQAMSRMMTMLDTEPRGRDLWTSSRTLGQNVPTAGSASEWRSPARSPRSPRARSRLKGDAPSDHGVRSDQGARVPEGVSACGRLEDGRRTCFMTTSPRQAAWRHRPEGRFTAAAVPL